MKKDVVQSPLQEQYLTSHNQNYILKSLTMEQGFLYVKWPAEADFHVSHGLI